MRRGALRRLLRARREALGRGRRLGSAALDLAWLAAGRYDAYYEYGLNAWDWAAGEMLCQAVGLETRHLEALPGTGAGLLVAAPAIAPALLELVNGFTAEPQGH